jgi:hypothetical protein
MTKRVTKHDGEVIELVGGDDHYVRGHFTPQEAKEILDAHYDDLNHDVTKIRAAYARWSCDGNGEDFGDNHSFRVLNEYAQPGAGRFRVMVCTGWRDFTDDELAALNAAREVPDAKT